MGSANIKVTLHALFTQMTQLIDEDLAQQLPAGNVLHAETFVRHDNHIQHELDIPALQQALHAYHDFAIHHSPRHVTRTGGIIIPKHNVDDIAQTVQRINQLKKDIHHLVMFDTTEPDSPEAVHKNDNQRAQTFREVFPALQSGQLYREIICIDKPIKSVSFSYKDKQTPKILSLAQAIELCASTHIAAYNEQMKTDLSFIQSQPDFVSFQMQRMHYAVPMIQLMCDDGHSLQYNVTTPVILLAQGQRNNPYPKVKPMKPPIHQQKSLRTARVRREPIDNTPLDAIYVLPQEVEL